jgi:hypothetical protein
MLEYWKNGFWDTGGWVNDITVMKLELKLIISFRKPTIPLFHDSTIP